MTRADPARMRRHVEQLACVVRSERHDPDGMRHAWSYITAHLGEAGWQVSEQPLSLSWRIGLADDVQPGGWWPIRVSADYRAATCWPLLPPAARGRRW